MDPWLYDSWHITLFLVFSITVLYLFGSLKKYGVAKQALPGPRPWPIVGNFLEINKMGHINFDLQCLIKVFEMRTPSLLIADPKILREVFVKKFNLFTDRRVEFTDYPINLSIFGLNGDAWKRIRNLMTPAFTTGKLKQMSSIINSCTNILVECLGKVSKRGDDINIKSQTNSFSMDVITQSAFGVEVNSQNNPDDAYVNHARNFFKISTFNSLIRIACPWLTPWLQNYSSFKPSTDFFMGLSKELVKKGKQDAYGKQNNIFHMMLKIQENTEHHMLSQEDKELELDINMEELNKIKGMTLEELTAQCIILFVAGSETTGGTIAYLCYHLALDQEVQRKLIEEVDEIVGDEKVISNEICNKLVYMDQCFDEVLRLYPPAIRINRVAKEDTIINGIRIDKGMVVTIPIFAMHRLPQFWPNPDKFDPGRFAPEEKGKRDPFVYNPFGQGPRNCIGMRFAKIEMKIAMSRILQNFKFSQSKNTEYPLEFEKTNALVLKNRLLIKVHPRQTCDA